MRPRRDDDLDEEFVRIGRQQRLRWRTKEIDQDLHGFHRLEHERLPLFDQLIDAEARVHGRLSAGCN